MRIIGLLKLNYEMLGSDVAGHVDALGKSDAVSAW